MHAFLLIAALATSQWTMSDASPSGTLSAPLILTGNNAGGMGTLRIRPPDEDTQVVLCEASNNASPEVCTSFQHANSSTGTSYGEIATNAYADSAGAYQRYNTSFGYGVLYTQASSTNASNVVGQQVYSTNGTFSGSAYLKVSGAGTATFSTGENGTVTNDFRGPITNGGGAGCNSVSAGSVCVTDVLNVSSGTNTELNVHSTSATSVAYLGLMDTAGSVKANFGFANASFSDADLAGKAYWGGVSTELVTARSDDVGVTSVSARWMDNYSATGVTHMALYGGGTIAYPQTQTVTCADNGGGTNATQTLDPQAHTITVLNNDATGCDVTMQETSAQLGAVAIICIDPASTATNVNFADVANVFNGAGATVALSQGDCMEIRYFDAANDLWLMVAPVGNN